MIESPTGCTKQLISVAVSVVPAAELMRPAGMKPRSCASWNFVSHCARLSSGSAMRERARHAPAHVLDRAFLSLGVLLDQNLARDLLLGEWRKRLDFLTMISGFNGLH